MARSPERKSAHHQRKPVGKSWTSLTWDDLDRWAGDRSVQRGRQYERQGRVRDLAIAEDGRLLATVIGREKYAVMVALGGEDRREKLHSRCTCPVGFNGCKHAVAVVAKYLDMLASEQEVPVADPDDARWDDLLEVESGAGEDTEDEFAEDEDEDEDEESQPSPSRRRRASKASLDQKIRAHIDARSHEELVDLVWSLVERFPELHEEYRERITLGEGDADQLVKQARQELEQVTSETGWRNGWTGEGYTPDYSRLRSRLERLNELGHHDAVLPLGREIIQRGMRQIEQSGDEGETAQEVAGCMPAVFQAVARSSLPASRKLLYVIDAQLKDEFDIIGTADDVVMKGAYTPADWSAVAGELAGRLSGRSSALDDDYARDYHRDQISNQLIHALKKAGRGDEVLAVMEREAAATGSYVRLVEHLIQHRRYDDADRWASEGISKTDRKYSGIASSLADLMCETARRRKRWDLVAAHAAWRFFEHPGMETFKQFMAAAAKAGCEEMVRRLALQFLETGVSPMRLPAAGKGSGQAAASDSWPLPVPAHLAHLMKSEGHFREPAHPHYDVLIDLAIAEKRPDDALRWYDRTQEGRKRPADRYGGYGWSGSGDRVAQAVARTHPERALEIYRQRIDAHLPNASLSAYETVAVYLRKMRPIYKSLGREMDWTQLVAEIRMDYRNRPRFVEILDKLDGRTILQTQRRAR